MSRSTSMHRGPPGPSMRETAVSSANSVPSRRKPTGLSPLPVVIARSRPRAPSRWASSTRRKRCEKKRSAATPMASPASQPNSTSAARLNWITRRPASMHMIAAGAPSSVAASRASAARSRPSVSLRAAPEAAIARARSSSSRIGSGPSAGASPWPIARAAVVTAVATSAMRRETVIVNPSASTSSATPAPTQPVAGDSACRTRPAVSAPSGRVAATRRSRWPRSEIVVLDCRSFMG